MRKIKDIIKKNKTLIHNYSYLSILQIFNLVLPLITYPYLIRILGTDLYGLIVFAMAISFFLSIIIEFGFSIIGTKEISINRDNNQKLSEIVSSIIIIKLVLGLFSFILLYLIVFNIPSFSEHKLLYLFSFIICFNEIFFSQWFFQGVEEMKYITIISVISRLCFVFLILLLVKSKSDYLLVPVLHGFGAVVNSVISLYVIFGVKKIKFILPDKKNLIFYFKKAAPLFFGRLTSKIKDQSNVILIGSSIGMIQVAYYDLVMKLINIANSFIESITVTIFPKISHSGSSEMTRKFFVLTLSSVIIGYFSFIIFGKDVILILGGEKMLAASDLLPLMALFLLRSSSFFIGNIVLLINNKIKPYTESLYISAGIYFICITLVYLLKVNFTIELFVVISLISLILEYTYRIYACKKFDLLDNLMKKSKK